MPYRDTYHRNDVVKLQEAKVLSADTPSESIDLQNRNTCLVEVNVGESGDTLSGSVYFTLALQESDDNSVWNAVAAGDQLNKGAGASGIFATIDAAAEDSTVYITGYSGSKRYVRVNIDFTGTHTNGTPIGAVAIAEPNNQPANNTTFAG